MAQERPESGLAAALAEGHTLAGPLVTELAHDGDAAAIEVIELIGTRLGVAITSFVNIFNPEVVVIGGSVMAAGELLGVEVLDHLVLSADRFRSIREAGGL